LAVVWGASQLIVSTISIEMRDKTKRESMSGEPMLSRHALERIAADRLHDQRRDARQNKELEHVG